jgi:hypothetical protein
MPHAEIESGHDADSLCMVQKNRKNFVKITFEQAISMFTSKNNFVKIYQALVEK